MKTSYLIARKGLSRVASLMLIGLFISVSVFALDEKNSSTSLKVLLQQQNKGVTVKGKVVDNMGEPIVGAHIAWNDVDGKLKRVAADLDGNFTITVPSKTTIITFSSVGFSAKKMAVKDKKTLKVVLAEDATELEELVVVGYGTQRKASIVGSVELVKADELQIPETNLTAALSGKLSGVVALVDNGRPGAVASMYIRGAASAHSTPLVVIDGINRSLSELNDMDPSIISSFSILKDASATAIYGTLGANGVIIVTTKSGEKLEKPRINVRIESSLRTPTTMPKIVDGPRYMELFQEAVQHPSSSEVDRRRYSAEQIRLTREGIDPLLYPNVDWVSELFRGHQTTKKATVNIQGGGNKARYFTSVSTSHDDGLFKNRSREFKSYDNNISLWRMVFQNNVAIDLTNTTKINLRLNVKLNNSTQPMTDPNTMFSLLRWRNPVDFPVFYDKEDSRRIYDKDNYEYGKDYTLWGGNQNSGISNPLAELVKGVSNTFGNTVNSNLDLNQKLDFITKGLSANILFSFKNWSRTDLIQKSSYNMFEPRQINLNADSTSVDTYILAPTNRKDLREENLSAETKIQGNREQYFKFQLNYNRIFADKHDVAATALYYQQETNNAKPAENILSIIPGRKNGVAGRLTYGYDSKYLLELNASYTGSETFARGNQYGFFPSMGFGYNISREDFWEPIRPYISMFKLKGSWGIVGSDRGPARFMFAPIVTLNHKDRWYTTGRNQDKTRNGPLFSRKNNDNISWEIADKKNIGLDMQLFNVVNVNLEFFKEHRYNIFTERSNFPTFLGFGDEKVYGNIKEVENFGFDGSVGFNHKFSKNFDLRARANFGFARNRILNWDEPPYVLYPGRMAKGHSLHQLAMFTTEGFYETEEDLKKYPETRYKKMGKAQIGDLRHKDIANINGETDGVIDGSDMTYQGHPTLPEITYGITLGAKYKRFDLEVFLQGYGNTSLMINNISPFGTDDQKRNVLQFISDSHWKAGQDNSNVFYPRLSVQDREINTDNSTFWYRDRDYIKLKNLTLSYSRSFYKVYIQGSNLLTISKFNLWDPDMGGNGLKYPTMRTFNLGIQFNL